MATPPHGFRAHDCGSLRARESRETSHGVGEPGRLHVVGIAAKCGIPPGPSCANQAAASVVRQGRGSARRLCLRRPESERALPG